MVYWMGVATLVGIYMIAILGVSILCGFTGMFSMGHAGFMAIGAYTSALLTKYFGIPVFLGVIIAMIAAAIVGAILSYPTLKLRDDYFVIVTLGIGEAIKLIIQNAAPLTGGARGLSDFPRAGSLPLTWLIVLVTIVLLRSFIHSKHGRNCIAVREEELAAQSVGISLFRYKMTAMVISCALCGCSGALLAHYIRYLHPNMFNLLKSEELVIVVILGGRGSLTGTILAGLVMLSLPELLRFGFAEQWRMVMYGFLVVLVILFRPSGLMGTRELGFKDIKTAISWVSNKLHRKKEVEG